MPDELDTLVDAFVAKLTELGYAPNPGASPELLARLETENGWKFPEAVRRYLLKANGCRCGFWGETGERGRDFLISWNFFAVEKWAEPAGYPGTSERLVASGWNSHRCVFFADYSFNAPSYGVCLNPISPVWGCVVPFDEVIPAECLGWPLDGNRFEDFIRGFVNDASEMYPIEYQREYPLEWKHKLGDGTSGAL